MSEKDLLKLIDSINYGSTRDNQSEQANQENKSQYTESDMFPKTNMFQTVSNITKSYIGLGILAAPYGYSLVGFLIATIFIIINGTLSTYTITLLIKCKESFKDVNIKSYSDLGFMVYGNWGKNIVSIFIFLSQFFLCVSYIMFFIQQMDSVIATQTQTHLEQNYILFFWIALISLIILTIFDSMKEVSFISLFSLLSILIALIYVMIFSIQEINENIYTKDLTLMKLDNIFYFFGISLFMFEGNPIALEIYHQTQNQKINYMPSLICSLSITTTIITATGVLAYSAFGQYTQPIILLNLDQRILGLLVQIFYSIGILGSCSLQLMPIFRIIKHSYLYQKTLKLQKFQKIKLILFKYFIISFCCILALLIPNLGQFLNVQGSFMGTSLVFLLPIIFYFKQNWENISMKEYIFCIVMLIYGVGGGLITTYFALIAMLQ